ncbi:LYR family protein, iron-sulfur cluster biosynthesis protein Isd11 [Histoplasma capsulatum G186AR]|uniref:LYR family protein, iron-sulfur cluster biosynthesis protein Isd11 n=1 Tax=Ajellomyces capsulatus TaxID=5037 RepID=A0A8H8CX64_AJECA|nr:LYR family protein, iron-sulfur cluster biosynthesis protein Isd11 [Histoplasma capsulatum]QSS75333.1 LYR family protein, iron-sulfur cluster biosynthesis protein Isd11 [Histoplasma capsulatum G186AR]
MPSFRSSRRSQALAETVPNRTRTGQVDHDVFEGFPVRRWVRQPVVIYQTPKTEQPDTRLGGPQALPELPMPRDSHLLTPMSRALLRAARAGCKYIRPAPPEVEGDEKETKDSDEPTAAPPFERTFTAGKWTLAPRHMEPPEAEFLAKRRPGLSSLYGSTALNGTAEVQPEPKPPMKKTKFKKIDPITGKTSIYEAWVPEGHKVEGEIIENADVVPGNSDVAVVAALPVPGTAAEGIGVGDPRGLVAEPDSSMVAPMEKQDPPSKRKASGIEKGSRKKVMFASGEGETADTALGDTDASQAPGDVMMSGTTQDGSSTASQILHEEDEEGDEETEDEESDEGRESSPESKSPETIIKLEQEGQGDVSTVPEKEEPILDMRDHALSPEQEQHKDTSIPARDMPSSPDLPLATAPSTSHISEPPREGLSPKPEQQPPPPVPTKNPSLTPVPPSAGTSLSDANKDASFNDQASKPSEPAGDDAESLANNQNGASNPQEYHYIPSNGVKPEIAQHSPPQENPHPALASTSTRPEPHSVPILFEDGEIDLLSSLEASLDNPGNDTAADVSRPDDARENNEFGESAVERKDVEMAG